MKEKKLVPRRRFKGFEEEFENITLEKLGSFGRNYAFSRAKEGQGDYFHIHYGDIHTKGFGLIDSKSKLPSLKEVEGNLELLNEGDVIIADASEDYKDLGKSVVIADIAKRKIIAGLHTFKFTPNSKLYPVYYLYYSQSEIYREFTSKIGTGISVLGITKDNLSKMELKIPFMDEQHKIAQFFMLLDKRIENQEKKIAKVKALKSAYLQEMFPQENENVPNRRFKGFGEKWKEEKLEDIGEIYQPTTIAANKLKRGIYKVFGANGYIGYHNKYNHEQQQVTVSCRGENSGKANLVESLSWITGNSMVINVDSNRDIYKLFLYYFLSNQNLGYLITGSGQPQIVRTDLNMHQVLIPSLKEQQKIGLFFKNLDNQIETEERKLAKLKSMKEAYLEEMFV